jgi:hypothetical protein
MSNKVRLMVFRVEESESGIGLSKRSDIKKNLVCNAVRLELVHIYRSLAGPDTIYCNQQNKIVVHRQDKFIFK